jgi:hypothetical protein
MTAGVPLTVVQPGEGDTGDLGTIGVAFKLWGRDTNGPSPQPPAGTPGPPRR